MASKKSRRRKAELEKQRKKTLLERKEVRIGIVLVSVIAIVAIAALFVYSGNDDSNNNGNGIDDDQNGNTPVGNPIAVIDTSMGTIKVELYEDKASITAGNFKDLANDGFYDGLVFHRVIDDFMIQGGGFESDGSSHNSDQISFESSPELLHVDGAISMASTDAKVGGSNQFFICDGDQHNLDNNYAVFGIVIEGIDVVRSIASVDTTTKNGMPNWPVDDVIINSITIENQ